MKNTQLKFQKLKKELKSVDALIHKKDDRVRKEFEKWAFSPIRTIAP